MRHILAKIQYFIAKLPNLFLCGYSTYDYSVPINGFLATFNANKLIMLSYCISVISAWLNSNLAHC